MGRPDSPSKTVVSDCGPRTVAEDAGALRILKPLEFDLRRISSLLATQALNPKGHLLVCAGVDWSSASFGRARAECPPARIGLRAGLQRAHLGSSRDGCGHKGNRAGIEAAGAAS